MLTYNSRKISPISPLPFNEFKYQSSDTVLTMQALEAVVPGTAEDFIRDNCSSRWELLTTSGRRT